MGAIGSAIAGAAIGYFASGGNAMGAAAGAIGTYAATKSEKQAEQAQEQMSDYYDKMYELSKEQLEWNKQLYREWKSIFGDIQEGLSKFYSSLTPDVFATRGITNVQQELQNALKQIRENFAQRGLLDSGIEANLEQQAQFQAALAEAQIRTNAPFQVANERLRFLALGMNQGTMAVSGVNQGYGAGLGALGTGVQMYGNLYNAFANQAAQNWAGLGSYLGQLQASRAYTQAMQAAQPTFSYYPSFFTPYSYGGLGFSLAQPATPMPTYNIGGSAITLPSFSLANTQSQTGFRF